MQRLEYRRRTLAEHPFNPISVPDLVLWLRNSRIRGLIDADTITTWIDSSRRLHDATQATEANKPLYKVDLVNGEPGARFDGVNDFLEVANHADFLIGANDDFTIMSVQDHIPAAADHRLLSKLNPGFTSVGSAGAIGFDCFLDHPSKNTLFRLDDDVVGAITLTSTATEPAGVWIQSLEFDRSSATGIKIRFDGNEEASADATTLGSLAGATRDLSVGSGPAGFVPGTWDIFEFLFFRRALGAGEHNRIGRYFARRYNLAWTDIP